MSKPDNKYPNSQKWTADAVTTYLRAIEKDANEGENLYIGSSLTKLGLYKHIWDYWKETYCQHDDIMERILRIESTYEAKILEGALKKKVSPAMATLTLKNDYSWGGEATRSVR
jgi:hypothetical protein